MESTIRIIEQLNIEEHTEEHEFRMLAESIQEEINTESELDQEIAGLTLKINEALNMLQQQAEKYTTMKESQKNEIKALNEHKMVGNKNIAGKITERQSQQNEIETRIMEMTKMYQNDWLTHSKSIDTNFVELQNENKALRNRFASFKQKITENEKTFDELQKEIEIKRENILNNNKQTEELAAATEKANHVIKECEERIKATEKQISVKDAEIANEKLNSLEITNRLALLRDFKVNKQTNDEQIANINQLKESNKESERTNASLQKQIDEMYSKLENYAETKIFPLQAIIRSKEPILKQRMEQKDNLWSGIQKEEQRLQIVKDEIEKRENDLKKTRENETILKNKIDEKKLELRKVSEQFENKKQGIIEIKSRIHKIRKRSRALIEDTQKMGHYLVAKEQDPLLRFTQTELIRDFDIDCNEQEIQIFGPELHSREELVEKEQKELNSLNNSFESFMENEFQEAMDQKNELESMNKEEEEALNKVIENKEKIASDLKKNNQDIENMKQEKKDLLKGVEVLKVKVSKEENSIETNLSMLDVFERKTLKAIDALHEEHIAIKKPLQRKNDKMSKHNIDAIHKLKKELNEEKTKYQHLKVKLRQMQRK